MPSSFLPAMGFLGQLATGFMQGSQMAQERERQRRAAAEDLAASQQRRSLLERESSRQEKADARQRAMDMLTLQGSAAFNDPAFQQAMRLTPEQAKSLGAKARVREEAELHGGITNFLRSPGAVEEYEAAFGKKFRREPGEFLGELRAPPLFRREDIRVGKPAMRPMIPRPQPGDIDIRGGLEALRPQGGLEVGAPYPVTGPERVVLPPTPSEIALAQKEREAALKMKYTRPKYQEILGAIALKNPDLVMAILRKQGILSAGEMEGEALGLMMKLAPEETMRLVMNKFMIESGQKVGANTRAQIDVAIAALEMRAKERLSADQRAKVQNQIDIWKEKVRLLYSPLPLGSERPIIPEEALEPDLPLDPGEGGKLRSYFYGPTR